MILTRQNALQLVSDHSLVAAIPELLPFVERKRAVTATLKPGCKSCQARSQFAPVGDEVLAVLLNLPADKVDAIRTRLADAHLFVYDPASRGRTLVEIGKR